MEVVGGVIETSLLELVGQADIFCCCPEAAVLFLFSLTRFPLTFPTFFLISISKVMVRWLLSAEMGTQALHVLINEVYEVTLACPELDIFFEIINTIDIGVLQRVFFLSRPPRLCVVEVILL